MAGQKLVAALIHLQSTEPRKAGGSATADTAYRETMTTLRNASAELRMLMSRLRTPVLDKFGLAAAIEDVVAQLRLVGAHPRSITATRSSSSVWSRPWRTRCSASPRRG